MRHSPALWVRRWWHGETGFAGAVLSLVTLPLEVLFRAGVGFRNILYRSGWIKARRVPLPVISVGNLSVGGTGKTPLSAWIAGELASLGASPAILSRGYGRDELLLHQRWNPGVPVYADPDRVASAELAGREGATVLILDDGFQHRRIHRDLDIVIVSADEVLPVRLLPRGPYRESLSALGRAGLVLISIGTSSEEAVRAMESEVRRRVGPTPVSRLRFRAGGWQDLDGRTAAPPAAPVVALSAVARPERFAALVGALVGGEVASLTYPDHHDYSSADVLGITEAAGGRTVVTTEKDAVKLRELAVSLPNVRVLTLAVELEEDGAALREALHTATGEVRE